MRPCASASGRSWSASRDVDGRRDPGRRGHRRPRVRVRGLAAAAPPARRFLTQFGHTFPNAPDPSGRVAVDYGVYGVPETFFIDRQGRVRFKHVGAVTDEIMKQHIEKLLKEPA